MHRTLTLMLLGLSFAATAQAQNPTAAVAASPTTRLMPFSGTAVGASGAAVKGLVAITFELFEDQDGGTALWRETQRVQTDDQGHYVAYLGAVNPMPQSAFTEERARWLGVTVQRRAQPRVVLMAVPYALRAADADTLGGQPARDFVRARADGHLETSAGLIGEAVVDGSGVPGQLAKFSTSTTLSSSVISESSSNRIGVGLPDPTGGGVVDSVFTIKNLDNNTGFAVLNESQARRFALNTQATGAWVAYDGGGGSWHPGISQLNGFVGIGNLSPEAELHVGNGGQPMVKIDGAVNVLGQGAKLRWTEVFSTDYGVEAMLDGGNDALIFRQLQAGAVTNDNLFVIKVFPTQGVGVGVLDPLDRFQVAGDIRVGTGTTGCVKDADATVIAGVCSSDRRLKKDITPFESSLDRVSRLQPVHFHWRADEFPDKHFGASESFGLVAQDVEKVLPELVTSDEDGYKAVRYNALPFHMLQAIKELKAENDGLKEQLAAQELRLRKLEAALIK